MELVPKGVVDVRSVQTATEVLGTSMAFPIMTSPTSAHIQLHQTDLGRDLGQCGTPTIKAIARTHVKVHLA